MRLYKGERVKVKMLPNEAPAYETQATVEEVEIEGKPTRPIQIVILRLDGKKCPPLLTGMKLCAKLRYGRYYTWSLPTDSGSLEIFQTPLSINMILGFDKESEDEKQGED